ncbi:MAG TPA: type II toxin-antitoxin system VapC family toxin [Acetobacteraceae bacterium]|nr:type II toxin-antitoxin system VapC family toxin [Acetobacteraceae bacterium]
MRLLLDTHAFLWWIAGDEALSLPARAAIADEGNEVFVSAASAWEIATKFRIGNLPGVATIVADLTSVLDAQGFIALPISFAHGQTAGGLPGPIKDPFDRMLIAQAMLVGLVLISNETPFDAYGVRRLW